MNTLKTLIALLFLSCGKSELIVPEEETTVDMTGKIITNSEFFSEGLVTLYYHSPNKSIKTKSKGFYSVTDTLVAGDKIIAYMGDISVKSSHLEFSISDGHSVKLNCRSKDSSYVSGVKIVGQ